MRKLTFISLFLLFILFSCNKSEPPCKCAIVTDAGYNKFGIPQQKLIFCDGDTMFWAVPDSTWRLDPSGCWEELKQLDSLKNVKLSSL